MNNKKRKTEFEQNRDHANLKLRSNQRLLIFFSNVNFVIPTDFIFQNAIYYIIYKPETIDNVYKYDIYNVNHRQN